MGFGINTYVVILCLFISFIISIIFASFTSSNKALIYSFVTCFILIFPNKIDVINYYIYSVKYTFFENFEYPKKQYKDLVIYFEDNPGDIINWCNYVCINIFISDTIRAVEFPGTKDSIEEYEFQKDKKQCRETDTGIKSLLSNEDKRKSFFKNCFLIHSKSQSDAFLHIEQRKIIISGGEINETIVFDRKNNIKIKNTNYWIKSNWRIVQSFERLMISDYSKIKMPDGSYRRFVSPIELTAIWAGQS